MTKNKLLIAAAWSGKTTYLVNEATKISDWNVLITTYTEENTASITEKIIREKWFIPQNIVIVPRFSFLMKYLVKPYQSVAFDVLFDKKIWFNLTNSSKNNKYNKTDIFYYFDLCNWRYVLRSDKISDFVYYINLKTNWENISRLSRIFNHIFIDEVQDLAWYDLEILKLIWESNSMLLLAWDPRQVAYLTTPSQKNKGYREWKIDQFLNKNCAWSFVIDTNTLNMSHRNHELICKFSSRLFPDKPVTKACRCKSCEKKSEHVWIFAISNNDIDRYCSLYNPQVLRWNNSTNWELNFWVSKGKTFNRVLIHLTNNMLLWLQNNNAVLPFAARCKLYIWITRAMSSVCFVIPEKLFSKEFDWVEKIFF